MSQSLHNDNNDDAKAIAIPQVFSENSRAKNVGKGFLEFFSSVVMVLAYKPGGPGSNPARIIYFCHAFINFFLCYGLCS